MLLSLHIKNYALIDDLRMELTPGLNIFTGETGTGKSIIIEALGLILGERASTQTIKKGASRCFITSEFDCSNLAELIEYLDSLGLAKDDGSTLILRREVDTSGKSRAFVNDCPATLSTLLSIGEYLVDVHGQHEHQTLIHSVNQRQLLDKYGNLEQFSSKVTEKYHAWKELLAQAQSQTISEQERQKLIDLYSFQIKEIDNAKLLPGEEEEIERDLPQLKNAEKLHLMGDEAYQILYNNEGSVLERLNKTHKLMENISSICGTLAETTENIRNSYYQIEECAREVESFYRNLKADPQKLNQLMERQDLIYRLKKKYGQSINEILQYRQNTARQLDNLTKSDQNRQQLQNNIEKAREELLRLCTKLTSERKKCGKTLSDNVEKELRDLGMKKVRFQVSIHVENEPSSHGMDRIDFLFSANPGEDAKPLKSIASGGEMSRVMLAVKTVLTKADNVPVLIFDEIDAGIGGPMGQTVGKKLQKLAHNHQVLCITHLPQIAAFGSQHFLVSKNVRGKDTHTHVQDLSDKNRVEEIARMLSGREITPAARKHATELIKQSD